MTLIKIKKSSIRKNPDAYIKSYRLPASSEATGTYKGDLPEWLNDKVIVTSAQYSTHDEPELEFTFITPVYIGIAKRLSEDKNATLTITNNYVDVQCSPQPEYLYNYTNPVLKCSNCNASVRFNSIQTDYIQDSDGDERTVDKCPICNELETFDYKFESIADALKR